MEPTPPAEPDVPSPAPEDERAAATHDDHEHLHHDHDHDHDHDEHVHENHAGPVARTGLERLARLAVDVGAGVVLVQTVFVVLCTVQGMSLQRGGANGFDGDLLHRIGIAYSISVNLQSGLALLLGVALVSVPMALPPGDRPLPALRRATLVTVAVVAAVIAVGTILGVRASLYNDHLSSPTITAYQRWELTAYVAGTLGTALVAFLAAISVMPNDEEPRS